ncbi:Arm DNA-binding domain-containing protein [Erwinia sp. MMLR14_017]|uniref:Arm DNA-binding domain-containing protein n=1 Tax=Erwinia sp. MMLR14_017 TaxID=3093842 RepID=UPI0039A0CA8D
MTARQIETTKPAKKNFKLPTERALFYLVTTTGKRYWRIKYRLAGKEKKLSFGVYPESSLMKV